MFIAMAGGNHFFNFSNLAIPWTAVTGIAKKIVRRDAPTITPISWRGKSLTGIAKFFHDTSLGSGANSVIHRRGFKECCDWEANAAPKRDLNVTKATGSSYRIWKIQMIE